MPIVKRIRMHICGFRSESYEKTIEAVNFFMKIRKSKKAVSAFAVEIIPTLKLHWKKVRKKKKYCLCEAFRHKLWRRFLTGKLQNS